MASLRTSFAVLVAILAAAPARADEPATAGSPEPAGGEPAAAPAASTEPPLSPRLFNIPTAWLQPSGHIFGSAGANHRGGGFFAVAAALGQLAEIDVEVTDRFVSCYGTCEGDARNPEHAWVVSALFKVGIAQGRLGSWQPAAAIGFRRSVYARPATMPADAEQDLAELYAAVSQRLGPAHFHLGVEAWDASTDGARLERLASVYLRPFAGFGWRPGLYPKTTLIADFGWVPEFPVADQDEALRWIAGWGIRYQAFSWGSIELGVRHREGDTLAGSTVMVRVNASGPARALFAR